MQTIYTDGISHFAFHGGIVKLKLASIRPDDKNQRQLVPAGLVEMSAPSLLRLHGQLGKVIEHMMERGILSEKTPENTK